MKPTPPRSYLNTGREYRGFSLADVATREGSLDILSKPSRFQKGKNQNEGKVLHNVPDAKK